MARLVLFCVLAFGLSGCVSAQRAEFASLQPHQAAIMREGRPGIVSRGATTQLSIMAPRTMPPGRPIFVFAVQNTGNAPVTFTLARAVAVQRLGQRTVTLPAIPYEQLVNEERTRQVVGAVLIAAAGAAAGVSAARSGSGWQSAVNQAIINANTQAALSASAARGEVNLALLEKMVAQDHTLMPGEWYGGQIHFTTPQDSPNGDLPQYTISIAVGTDVHSFSVSHVTSQR